MQLLTNHLPITVIATVTVLSVGFIITLVKAAADLRKFRNNIKPGDYANIDTGHSYSRAKLIQYAHPFYLFVITDTLEKIMVIKSKIYKP